MRILASILLTTSLAGCAYQQPLTTIITKLEELSLELIVDALDQTQLDECLTLLESFWKVMECACPECCSQADTRYEGIIKRLEEIVDKEKLTNTPTH